MKLYPLAIPVLVLILSSCFSASKTEEVKASYERFAAAVLARNADAVARAAPFLAEKVSEKALEALRNTLRTNPSVRIRVLNDSNAEAVLSDQNRTVIPFRKNEAGEWLVSEQIIRTQFIEFIPAR
jgi:hypothetical protein